MSIDIPIELVSKPCPQRDRNEFRSRRCEITSEFCKKVSALRNSGGGALFVHIGDIAPTDRSLHYFHELFDKPLNDLVDEGSLFIDTFTFLWLSDLSQGGEAQSHEFLVIVVRGSSQLSTPDFKTKVTTDHEITQPSPLTLYHLLKENRFKQDGTACLQGIDALSGEGRSVQFKYVKSEFKRIDTENINSFVTYMWEGLRLREYITSLSKNPNGGSYFVGTEETDKTYPLYVSKDIQKTGIHILPVCKPLIQKELDDKITTITLCPQSNDTPIIKCALHTLEEKPSAYIIEVAVRPVRGCAFYDIHGPEAYELTNTGVNRIPFPKWHAKFMQRL